MVPVRTPPWDSITMSDSQNVQRRAAERQVLGVVNARLHKAVRLQLEREAPLAELAATCPDPTHRCEAFVNFCEQPGGIREGDAGCSGCTLLAE